MDSDEMPWNLSFDRGIETVSRLWVCNLFYGRGPYPLLGSSSWATCGENNNNWCT